MKKNNDLVEQRSSDTDNSLLRDSFPPTFYNAFGTLSVNCVLMIMKGLNDAR